MLKDRNLTSHIYDEKTALRISENIIKKYIPVMEALIIKIQE